MRSLIVAFDTEGSLDKIHDLAFVVLGWYEDELHLVDGVAITGDVSTKHGIAAFRRHLMYVLEKYRCTYISGLCWSKHDERVFESTRKKLMDVPFIYHDLLEEFRTDRKKHFGVPLTAPSAIGKLGILYISPHYNQKHNALDDTLDMIKIMEMQDAQIVSGDYHTSRTEMELDVDRHRCWTRLVTRLDVRTPSTRVDAPVDVVEYEGTRYTIRKGWTPENHYGYGLYNGNKLVRARKQEILSNGVVIDELEIGKLNIE